MAGEITAGRLPGGDRLVAALFQAGSRRFFRATCILKGRPPARRVLVGPAQSRYAAGGYRLARRYVAVAPVRALDCIALVGALVAQQRRCILCAAIWQYRRGCRRIACSI